MGIIVLTSFISLDGVKQAPGRSTEDTCDGFTHGGWFVPFADEVFGELIVSIFHRPTALLL